MLRYVSILVRVTLGSIVLFCFAIALLIGLREWSLMSGVDWNRTAAVYKEDNSVRALVHQYTDDPFDGWNVELIWQKDPDKWFVYYLDHKSWGGDYQLKMKAGTIVVYRDGDVLGRLDTKNAVFFHAGQNFTYKKPIEVIHEAGMDDYQKWSYWTDEKGDRLYSR